MIVPDDVASWYASLVNSDAVLATLVPGKFVAERANEHAPAPYGVFSVALAEEVRNNSGIRNYPVFRIECAIYADLNTPADITAIQTRMAVVMRRRPAVVSLRNPEEQVQLVRPVDASASYVPTLRNANDIVATRLAWLIMCAGRMDIA